MLLLLLGYFLIMLEIHYVRRMLRKQLACPANAGGIRDKVTLKPGHSLLDWIRLGNSGKDLTGVNGVMQTVTPQELALHNRTEDAWIVIHGVVYNITHYLDFHPGGVEELMKGAGYDATEIFNKIHPWVNYKTILQKCVVGRIQFNDEAIDITGASISFKKQTSKKENQVKNADHDILNQRPDLLKKLEIFPTQIKLTDPEASFPKEPSVKFNQNNEEFDLEISLEDISPNHIEIISLQNNSELLILVEIPESRLFFCLFHYIFVNEVDWPCTYIKMSPNLCHIKFDKKHKNLVYLPPLQYINYVLNNQKIFKNMEVVSIKTISHDTKLIILKYCDKIINVIPPGHHIYIKSEKALQSRPYTPIPTNLDCNSSESIEIENICIMVKQYINGNVSKELCSMKPGDKILASGPYGTFQMPKLEENFILLIAAGTGITPMLNIIKNINEYYSTKMFLIYFNKKECDILWREQLDSLSQKDNEKFNVLHILSEAESSWQGVKGKVTLELLTTHIPAQVVECHALICGPPTFNQLTREYLLNLRFQADKLHCFG